MSTRLWRSTWTLTCYTFVSLSNLAAMKHEILPLPFVRRSYINNDRTSWLVTRVMTQFVGTPPRTLELK